MSYQGCELLNQIPSFHIFPIFQYHQHTGHPLNISATYGSLSNSYPDLGIIII